MTNGDKILNTLEDIKKHLKALVHIQAMKLLEEQDLAGKFPRDKQKNYFAREDYIKKVIDTAYMKEEAGTDLKEKKR